MGLGVVDEQKQKQQKECFIDSKILIKSDFTDFQLIVLRTNGSIDYTGGDLIDLSSSSSSSSIDSLDEMDKEEKSETQTRYRLFLSKDMISKTSSAVMKEWIIDNSLLKVDDFCFEEYELFFQFLNPSLCIF